ncbi:hypothetical protein GUJ93_ZPchr0006g44297 [Zizania palustris]|uniref:Uncharacterized protein n=1 Tax=Zizania palustris TaxID=103762 RepID=A0A8J5S8W4_ZIZPA|nr:hypothetical protein GUJ93_ZPchr0006g44297 [Zizania palustris]
MTCGAQVDSRGWGHENRGRGASSPPVRGDFLGRAPGGGRWNRGSLAFLYRGRSAYRIRNISQNLNTGAEVNCSAEAAAEI